MRRTLIQLAALLSFSALAQNEAAIAGNMFVHQGGSLSFLGDLSIQSGALVIQGNLHLSGSVSGAANLELSPLANLYLSNNGTLQIQHETNEVINALTCSGNASLTVPAGQTLLVSGTFINNSSGTGLHLLANNTAYAQFKVNGTASGSGQVHMEQYVPSLGWHNVSMPVAGMLDQFGTVNTAIHPNTRNIYYWNETTSQWIDPAGATNGSTTANVPGRGYMVFVGTNGVMGTPGIIDVQGQLLTNADPILTNAGNSGNADFDQWNLVANPFTCGLDFSLLSRNHLYNSFSVWDPSTNSHKDYSGLVGDFANPVIAPLQSFWVRASGASPSLSNLAMSGVGTLDFASAFYKTLTTVSDRFFVRVYEAQQPLISDEILVGMVIGTSDGLDEEWDAPSKYNAPEMPTLMMLANGERISHNAIDYSPSRTDTKSLPVHMYSNQHGKAYRIALEDSLMFNSYTIEIEDLKQHQLHDLGVSEYVFNHDTAFVGHRFVLHINANNIGMNDYPMEAIRIGQHHEQMEALVHFDLPSSHQAKIIVTNVLGQIMYQQQHDAQGTVHVPVGHKGLYMISVQMNEINRVQQLLF